MSDSVKTRSPGRGSGKPRARQKARICAGVDPGALGHLVQVERRLLGVHRLLQGHQLEGAVGLGPGHLVGRDAEGQHGVAQDGGHRLRAGPPPRSRSRERCSSLVGSRDRRRGRRRQQGFARGSHVDQAGSSPGAPQRDRCHRRPTGRARGPTAAPGGRRASGRRRTGDPWAVGASCTSRPWPSHASGSQRAQGQARRRRSRAPARRARSAAAAPVAGSWPGPGAVGCAGWTTSGQVQVGPTTDSTQANRSRPPLAGAGGTRPGPGAAVARAQPRPASALTASPTVGRRRRREPLASPAGPVGARPGAASGWSIAVEQLGRRLQARRRQASGVRRSDRRPPAAALVEPAATRRRRPRTARPRSRSPVRRQWSARATRAAPSAGPGARAPSPMDCRGRARTSSWNPHRSRAPHSTGGVGPGAAVGRRPAAGRPGWPRSARVQRGVGHAQRIRRRVCASHPLATCSAAGRPPGTRRWRPTRRRSAAPRPRGRRGGGSPRGRATRSTAVWGSG